MGENAPCPSCGNADLLEFNPYPEGFTRGLIVVCGKCQMRGPKAAWNWRYVTPPLQEAYAAIETLRDAVAGLLRCSLPYYGFSQPLIDRAREALQKTESLDFRHAKGEIDSNESV